MSLGLLFWIGFVIFALSIALIHYPHQPTIQRPSTKYENHTSKGIRKFYYTLRSYGLEPNTNIKFGRLMIDIALIDAKLAVILYSAEDLLNPKKVDKLEKAEKLLVQNGWYVIKVREKDLTKNFKEYLDTLLSQANKRSITKV